MVTVKRDLRTGTSVWSVERVPPVPHAKLTTDLTTEVLVVGAGISGAFMAEALSERHRVTIIDRRGVAKGSTAASTALITSELDVPLTQLARKIGKANAVRAWRRAAIALQAIEARSAFLGLAENARLVRRGSLYVAGDRLGPDELASEGAARRAAGLPVAYLTGEQLREQFGVNGTAALFSFGHLAADPVRLSAAYLRKAIGRGAKLFAPVEAVKVEAGRSGVVVDTAGGPTIRAEHVIFCTGYEVPKFLVLGRAQIRSTYAYATRRQVRRSWRTPCLIWEASDPYLYVRDTLDGRVLCGGEDEDIADAAERDALIPAKLRKLQRKLGDLLPALDTEPELVWSGSFGETKTGLPLIGKVRHRKGCWAVLGFGGNGTLFARIAADIISTALAGGEDVDADLFALPG